MAKDAVTVPEAAAALGLTKQQVLNRIHRKMIPAEKVGWFWSIKRTALRSVKAKLTKNK